MKLILCDHTRSDATQSEAGQVKSYIFKQLIPRDKNKSVGERIVDKHCLYDTKMPTKNHNR
jgi:hypothetical protein